MQKYFIVLDVCWVVSHIRFSIGAGCPIPNGTLGPDHLVVWVAIKLWASVYNTRARARTESGGRERHPHAYVKRELWI